MGLPLQHLSLEAFLAWENEQPDRHEYHRGEYFCMVGGRRGHGRVIANLMRHLGNHFDASSCQAFSENMKVQVGIDSILYPDVFVTCDKHFSATETVFTSPVVVIEVLSPSTQEYDRNAKFAIYRRLASLREYALIDPDTRRVEVFRPQPDGNWSLFDMTERGSIHLECVDFELSIEKLFHGMDSAPELQ